MTLVVAHRGSGPFGPEPENTVAAFRAARSLGADGVELDVRRTNDRRLAVHHDAQLADGRVICELEARALPSEVPSLAEALDASDGMMVNVEVKNVRADVDFDSSQWVARESARIVAERIAAEPDRMAVVVSSFSRRALQAVRETAPSLETAWLVGLNLADADVLTIAAADGLQGVHPFDPMVDARLVEAAHAAGLAIRVWTVNSADRIAELGDFGVDAVVTNDVSMALRALGDPQLASEPSSREQSGA